MRQPKTKTNYFPKISTYLNLNNANSYENTPSLFSSTRKPLKQISESASTTDFFARNYDNYLEKVKQRNKVYNSTLKSEFELNSLLYKLKNYYSDVVSINTKKKQTIEKIKDGSYWGLEYGYAGNVTKLVCKTSKSSSSSTSLMINLLSLALVLFIF